MLCLPSTHYRVSWTFRCLLGSPKPSFDDYIFTEAKQKMITAAVEQLGAPSD
jgi:hypothetical protein